MYDNIIILIKYAYIYKRWMEATMIFVKDIRYDKKTSLVKYSL